MAWIRFDTAVLFDDFCAELSGDEFKAWAYLLLYVKAAGARGSAPVLSDARLASMCGVPVAAIRKMLQKAGDKLKVENGRIYVKNWRKYQEDYRDKSASPENTGDDTEATTPQYNNTTVQDNTRQKEKKRTPESLDEVIILFRERKYANPEREAAKFFDYYTANGWRVGRNPMKDWRAAAANWNRNAQNYGRASPEDALIDRPRKSRWEYCFVCESDQPPGHKCKNTSAGNS